MIPGMLSIRYEAPATIADAVKLIQADPGAKILAGGTDLLVQFRAGVRQPTAFVDVKRIPDLIGSTQIQGRGTVGGNLCNASPAADTTCALIVDRAVCVIAGPNGERTIPVEQFVLGPGKTVLDRGELLVAIRVPRPGARTADAYLRLIPRSEMDIAVAGAGVSVTLDASGTCTAARVAIGAVAPTARLVPEAGDALVGTKLDEAALNRAAQAASAAASPIDDKRGTVAYRRQVVGVLARRAATIAAARAEHTGKN